MIHAWNASLVVTGWTVNLVLGSLGMESQQIPAAAEVRFGTAPATVAFTTLEPSPPQASDGLSMAAKVERLLPINAGEQQTAQSSEGDVINGVRLLFRKGQLDEAVAELDRRIANDPNDAKLFLARAWCWHFKQQPERAIEDTSFAIGLDDSLAEAYALRAMCWANQRQFCSAVADSTAAMERGFDAGWLFHCRAYSLYSLQRYREAAADYAECLAREPQNTSAAGALAAVLATCPDRSLRDGARAVELAKQSLQKSSGHDSSRLSVLAAAYAESGEFARALEIQRQVVASEPGIQSRAALLLYILKERPAEDSLAGLVRSPAAIGLGAIGLLMLFASGRVLRLAQVWLR